MTAYFCCKGKYLPFYYAVGWILERILCPDTSPELKQLASLSMLRFLLMFTHPCLPLSLLHEDNEEKELLSSHVLIQNKYFELYLVD